MKDIRTNLIYVKQFVTKSYLAQLVNNIKYRFQRLKEALHIKRFSSLNRADKAFLQE